MWDEESDFITYYKNLILCNIYHFGEFYIELDKIIDGLLPSHSMGKSLVSYVTGHAICEGYIDSVNVRLNDWPLIKNTLYEDSILFDLLNMKAGDQKWVGERRNVGSDNRINL